MKNEVFKFDRSSNGDVTRRRVGLSRSEIAPSRRLLPTPKQKGFEERVLHPSVSGITSGAWRRSVLGQKVSEKDMEAVAWMVWILWAMGFFFFGCKYKMQTGVECKI